MFKRKLLINAILLTGLAGGFYSSAWAASITEPAASDNDICGTASSGGAIPSVVKGGLNVSEGGGDALDFFTFTGTPGAVVKISVKNAASSSVNPVLRVFEAPTVSEPEADCLPLSDENLTDFVATVPEDGLLVVRVTPSDINNAKGDYLLTLAETTEIDSISATLIDSATQKVLPGATAELQFCVKKACWMVDTDISDRDGTVEWTSGDFNTFEVGSYKIVASKNGYKTATTAKVPVAKDEAKDFGDIALTPKAIRMSGPLTCTVSGLGGGLLGLGLGADMCRYSVVITNNQTTPFKATVESIVYGYDVYDYGTYGMISLSPQSISLPSSGKKTVSFQFKVPADALEDAVLCPQVDLVTGSRAFGKKIEASNSFCIRNDGNIGWTSTGNGFRN